MDVGSGGGEVKLDEVTLPSYPYTIDINSSTTVSVEAVPDFFHVFKGWTGDLRTTSDKAILMVDCDKEIYAQFSLNWRLIGFSGGSLVLVILLGIVLIVRRNFN